MTKRFALLLLIVGFGTCHSYGQYTSSTPNIIPPSPEAMQFQKYGDYPVSHFTGIPDITIPVYTIKEGDLEVPITLTYHAFGYRPTDLDGIVGLGWTLNIGGQISRTVVDKEDERTNWVDYGGMTYPYESSVNTYNLSYNYDVYAYMQKIESKLQPDIFSYDFLGNHGKFILKDYDPTQCVLLDYKPLSIIGTEDDGPIVSFNVKDEQGRTFYFGQADGGEDVSDAWKLTSIKSPIDTSNQITYSYIYNGITEINWTRLDGYIKDDNESDYIVERSVCDQAWFMQQLMVKNVEDEFPEYKDARYGPMVPSIINFRSGNIKFTYDTATKMLSSIDIYNPSNQLLKKIQLVIQKRTPATGYKRRAFLKKVQFYDSTSTFINEYSLNYINENFNMPDYVSVDYWGYYNGSLNTSGENSDLIPKMYLELFDYLGNSPSHVIGKSYRRSSEENMKTFVLDEIVYPTGGKTVFEYEANKYDGDDGVIPNDYGQTDVGGLRIKRILNYSQPDQLATAKEYEYPVSHMDIIPSRPYFTRSERRHILRDDQQGFENYRRIYVKSDPYVNLAPHGSPVVYPTVKEYMKEVENNQVTENTLGTTTYEYDYTPFDGYKFSTTNGAEGDGSYPLYSPYYGLIKAMNDGKLIGVSYEGSSTVNYTSYTYEEVPLEELHFFYADRYAAYDADPCPSGDFPDIYDKPDYYYYYLGSSLSYLNYGDVTIKPSIKRLTNVYTVEQGVATSIDYDYSNNIHNLPTTKTVTNSQGEVIKTTYKYPHEMSSTTTPNIYNEMVDRHIWSPVIEQSTYKGTANTFLQSIKTNYDYWNSYEWNSSSTTSAILPRTIEAKKQTNATETRVRYNSYDSRANITSVSKENDVKKTYLWGYNQTYPIAEIENAELKDVFYTSFEESGETNIANEGKTGRRSKTGGFTQALNNLTNGEYILSYWQKSGTNWVLITGKVPVTGNSYTINLSGQVDEVRFYPVGAFMTTYTYDSLIGKTSQTDTNNKTTYYEYDTALRLIHILDDKRNLLKKYSYSYQDNSTTTQTAPDWQETGNTYCEPCSIDNSFNTGMKMVEEVDNNPNSYTSGQKRWIRQSSTSCGLASDYWQNTDNYRCITDGGQNTGEQERQQIFTNPCFSEYNHTRWVSVGTNTTACPMPSIFYNQDLSGNYTKSNCESPDYTGGDVYVSVPAGIYSSTISLADANDKAREYAQGIADADPSGTCTPIPFMLQGYNLTDMDFDVVLTDPDTDDILYEFISHQNSSWEDLGNILPGTYNISINQRDYVGDYTFTVGCNYTTTGYFVTISDVELRSACNLVEIMY